MIRKHFEQKIDDLIERLLKLGAQVESNLVKAVDSLTQLDPDMAQGIIIGDQDVNKQRLDIMTDALALIATQQPMAGDLRRIAGFIEIAGELERINDYSKGIAKNSLMITWEPFPVAKDDLTLMAQKTAGQLQQAMEAFQQKDIATARRIPEADDEVDDLFNKIYRDILSQVTAKPDAFRVLNFLEWALHNLERAADRVTNICEWVIYMETGIYSEMDSEFEVPPQ